MVIKVICCCEFELSLTVQERHDVVASKMLQTVVILLVWAVNSPKYPKTLSRAVYDK